MTDKPSYNSSSMNCFGKCGYRYKLQYMEKRRGLGNYFTLKGNGTHKARERNFTQKITSGVDLPLGDCTDAAWDEILTQIADDQIDLKSDELRGKSKTAVANLIYKDTSPLVERDHDALYHLTQPLYVEQRIAIELPDEEFNLYGTLDLIDTDYRVGDAKTSKKKLSPSNIENGLQMTLYWFLAQVWLGRPVPGGYFDFIYTGKHVTATRIPWTRTIDDVVKVLARFRSMHDSIKAGNFNPAPEGSWWCCPRWCRFYHECPFV